MWNRIVFGMMLALAAASGQNRPQPPRSVRLYVFDDGMIRGINPEMFHFKKEEVAVSDMVVASYLIVHPKGTLMWDSGAIPDKEIKGDGSVATQGLYSASKTLKSQLAAIGYAPKDITYFALSHYHGDHTANANDFAGATWLVQEPERDAMFGEKAPPITQQAHYSALKDAKTKILKGQDYDVFGDGTVVIKAAYGHTPGHQVLYVKLRRTGPVLLAGDLYHYQEERGTDKTPTFEFNREESLASRAAMEAFMKKTGAQMWIEHDVANFNQLKKSPDYYE
ncbi:MAG TPA: N-acyl homoserine lactonase family protein [Bryobacteraceae bacterium]|nr:N-acyl homoserine lactonase family protein [Bryobacteraceae bacterium]